MRPLSIEGRIRLEAASKISVRLTTRVRAQNGFRVRFSQAKSRYNEPRGYEYTCPTKAEALANLLAVLRCMSPVVVVVEPIKAKKGGAR